VWLGFPFMLPVWFVRLVCTPMLSGNVTATIYKASLTSLCQSFKRARPCGLQSKAAVCRFGRSLLGVWASLLYLEPTKTPQGRDNSGKGCQHGFF